MNNNDNNKKMNSPDTYLSSTLLEDDDNEYDNEYDDDDNDIDDDIDDELIISTVQIKILRKEADKRRNINRLPQFLLPIHIGEKMNLKHLEP